MEFEDLAKYLAAIKQQYERDLLEVKANACNEERLRAESLKATKKYWANQVAIMSSEREIKYKLKTDRVLDLSKQLEEENKRLEKENQQLREQLAHKPTNSLYVMAGALIEMLTTERRNQSGLKIDLQELGLKGFSEGSLNSNFAASNKALDEAKALKASKDGG